MRYRVVERNIGRARSKQEMLKKQAHWDETYGAGNWVTGYELPDGFKTRDEAIVEIYDKSYFDWLDRNPKFVDEILSYSGVYNPHALLSNSTDLQARSIERYIEIENLSFHGTRPLPVGAYQPKQMSPSVEAKVREMGLSVKEGKIVYPKISYKLSPYSVPCILDPSKSIEAFWQSGIKCLAIIDSGYSILVGDVFELAPEGSVICITTNGEVKQNGDAVMGRGIALIANTSLKPISHHSSLSRRLANYLLEYGNRAFHLGKYTHVPTGKVFTIVSFPTKEGWRDPSLTPLISKSLSELLDMANRFGWENIYLPAPGTENGLLRWNDIQSLLVELDSRFTIITKDPTLFN